jgi:hypothetical protein
MPPKVYHPLSAGLYVDRSLSSSLFFTIKAPFHYSDFAGFPQAFYMARLPM